MAGFRYNNAVTNQKNSDQSLMVMLLTVAWLLQLTSHFHVENLKKNEVWTVNLEKKPIKCCFCQIKTRHKLTAYLMYLCHLISVLYKYLNKKWAN